MKWFACMDMHSGGYSKTPFDNYFIEAKTEFEARERFEEVTGECPDAVACDCCGPNFSFTGEYDSLEEAAGYWSRGNVQEYLADPRNKVKVIPAEQIGHADDDWKDDPEAAI